MSRIYNNITETVGKTPLVRLNRVTEGIKSEVVAKLESFNPLGSVKDRIGVSMIESADRLHHVVMAGGMSAGVN